MGCIIVACRTEKGHLLRGIRQNNYEAVSSWMTWGGEASTQEFIVSLRSASRRGTVDGKILREIMKVALSVPSIELLLSLCQEFGADPNGYTILTPIRLAIEEDDREAVRILLELKADPNATMEETVTAAAGTLDISRNLNNKTWSTISAVLERSDWNRPWNKTWEEKESQILDLLLKYGANPELHRIHITDKKNLMDTHGDFILHPLELAVRKNLPNVTRCFLQHGFLGWKRVHSSNSPLHVAASFEAKEAALVLSKFDLDIECRDAENRTPLMVACSLGHLEVTKVLFFAGADVNATEKHQGRSAFFLAVEKRSEPVVEFLLKSYERPTLISRQVTRHIRGSIEYYAYYNAAFDDDLVRISNFVGELAAEVPPDLTMKDNEGISVFDLVKKSFEMTQLLAPFLQNSS
jgi:hypothetical protein